MSRIIAGIIAIGLSTALLMYRSRRDSDKEEKSDTAKETEQKIPPVPAETAQRAQPAAEQKAPSNTTRAPAAAVATKRVSQEPATGVAEPTTTTSQDELVSAPTEAAAVPPPQVPVQEPKPISKPATAEPKKEAFKVEPKVESKVETKVEVNAAVVEEYSDELRTAVEQWLKFDPQPKSRQSVQDLLDKKDYAGLKSLFLPRIAFGTAGLRSKMSYGYRNMNELVILQTAQGLCRYMQSELGSEEASTRGIVIGYDGRHNSKTFAELAASVMLLQDIKVYLFDSYTCTPYVPFAVTKLNCAAGVMVTASHNPKQDNGFKVYWSNGAQIIPPQDAGISKAILENLDLWPSTVAIAKDIIPRTTPNSLATVSALQPNELLVCSPEFSSMIERSYNEEAIRTVGTYIDGNEHATVKACYTAMHGVGAKFTRSILKAFNFDLTKVIVETKEQVEPDPEFPTVAFPNPEEGKGSLALAMKAADEAGAEVILANDPDADRLAVAVKENGVWCILTGNEIAALFAQWMWRQRRHWEHTRSVPDSKFVMAASTVSSKHLKSMAKIEGFEFRDTLTGFKWIGNELLKAKSQGYTPLFGFEVEIGFLLGAMTADKDGVRSVAAMVEMINYYNSTGSSLMKELKGFYERYGYFKMINSYFFCDKAEKLEAIFSELRNWPEANVDGYPAFCGPYKIKSVRDISEGYDSEHEDKRCRLPQVRDSYMITFTFENGATATVRNSGTEPKLKYYVECAAPKPEAAQSLLEDVTKELINNFLKPEVFGLIPKKAD